MSSYPPPTDYVDPEHPDPPEDDDPPLTGLAALFDLDAVKAELMGRQPSLLRTENSSKLDHIVRGVAAEVTQLVERLPEPGWVRDLAVSCMHLGVASRVESSAFPEQQGQGDQGRAQLLQARYLGARGQLLQAAQDGGADGVITAGASGGGFRTPGDWNDGAQRPLHGRVIVMAPGYY